MYMYIHRTQDTTLISIHALKHYTCGSKMMSVWHTIITLIFIFQLDCFMINLLDDYHNILSKYVPTDLQKTKIAHMASSMLDIHPHIPAIKRTTVSPHRQVKINIRGETRHALEEPTVVQYYYTSTGVSKTWEITSSINFQHKWKNLNPGNFHNLVQNFR